MNLILGFLLLCTSLILFGGCASNPASIGHKTPRQLNHWVEQQLVPYVVKQLGQHPKFKNQPFLVVSMKGDDIQPEIDDLTHYIRNRIIAALLQTPGVNPRWRPTARPWKHHRRLADLSCGEFSQVRYYIGIDIHFSPLNQATEVSIRALDTHQNSWVSGFYQSWHGRLNPAQHKALNHRYQDEYLRGLRPLPFTASQPDLLASYLAHNLSCLLRHSQSDDEVLIYARHPATEIRPYFRTALGLVDNYLGRFREVQITHEAQQASVILESQVHYLHDRLYQVWVTLRKAQGNRHLPGTETEAYVQLPGAPPAESHAGTHLASPGNEARSPLAAKFIPEHQVKLSRGSGTAINSLRFVMTKSQINCTSERRPLGENRNIKFKEGLINSPCLIMEISVNKALRLLIVGQNGQGKLNWIAPSPCEGSQSGGILLKAGETFHYPLPSQKEARPIKDIGGSSTKGRIYVITMVDKELRRNPHHRARLMANRLGLCAGQQASLSSWKAYLRHLLVESGPGIEWKTVPFPSCQANKCIHEVYP